MNQRIESNEQEVRIKWCQFLNTRSETDGSACNVQSKNGLVIIENSFFEDCRCNRKGGALYIIGNKFLSNCNCFHLCRCGNPNGSDGSTIYAECSDEINLTYTTCYECPRYGDMCWYGICNIWYADLSSTNVNISHSETEYVCGLAHCASSRNKSHIKYYMSISGHRGNSLTFVNTRFSGDHQYGNIINNSVTSGLIYFQNSQTTIKNFIFISNKGPLTYACVGVSNGIFENCLFDIRNIDKGIGFNRTISCGFHHGLTLIPMKMYNSYGCIAKIETGNDEKSTKKLTLLFVVLLLNVVVFHFIINWKSSSNNFCLSFKYNPL